MSQSKPNNECSIEATWHPSAALEIIRYKARLLTKIRQFFAQRNVMEVETPYLSQAAVTDPNIESFYTTFKQGTQNRQFFLHTSPEYFMKRLLAAGSGPIYQICRVFRQNELGKHHNPEFTMLEWYRPGFDYVELMKEVDDLVRFLGNISQPSKLVRFNDLFKAYLDIDIHQTTVEEMRTVFINSGEVDVPGLGLDPDAYIDLLFSHLIVPRLDANLFTFVYDYPATQASLARISNVQPFVAQRFELYFGDIELANGFFELDDPVEHIQRFKQDLSKRKARSLGKVPIDSNLIDALKCGLPECSGVAVGLDRLCMALTKKSTIDDVLAFSFART